MEIERVTDVKDDQLIFKNGETGNKYTFCKHNPLIFFQMHILFILAQRNDAMFILALWNSELKKMDFYKISESKPSSNVKNTYLF